MTRQGHEGLGAPLLPAVAMQNPKYYRRETGMLAGDAIACQSVFPKGFEDFSEQPQFCGRKGDILVTGIGGFMIVDS